MFDNIGGKIKNLAVISTWIGIIFSIILAIATWVCEFGFLLGLIVLVVGFLCSWIGSFLLYGFGELIVRIQSIDEKLNNRATTPKVKPLSPPTITEHEVELPGEEYPEEEDCEKEPEEEYLAEDDMDFDERNIAKQNECPSCFHKISPSDRECNYCGYKLKGR